MKRITTIALCFFASLGVLASASAQDNAATAKVPFDFNVGNSWLPAGTYTISSDVSNPYAIAIRSADNKVSVLTIAEADGNKSTSGKLVFAKIGGQYFLHEILCSACHLNDEFPSSKHEREARTREAGVATTTDVFLALK